MSSFAGALQILLEAIEGERSALVALDGVALVKAGEAKLAALGAPVASAAAAAASAPETGASK